MSALESFSFVTYGATIVRLLVRVSVKPKGKPDGVVADAPRRLGVRGAEGLGAEASAQLFNVARRLEPLDLDLSIRTCVDVSGGDDVAGRSGRDRLQAVCEAAEGRATVSDRPFRTRSGPAARCSQGTRGSFAGAERRRRLCLLPVLGRPLMGTSSAADRIV